jgi:hypothetical protein
LSGTACQRGLGRIKPTAMFKKESRGQAKLDLTNRTYDE